MRRPNSSLNGDTRVKITLCFVSFFIGLQCRTVLDLFSPRYSNNINGPSAGNHNDAAWLPEGAGHERRKSKRTTQGRQIEQHGEHAASDTETDTETDAPTDAPTMAPKKRKKKKKIPRYNMYNFTETPEPMPWSLPELKHSLISADEFMALYAKEKKRLNMDIPWENPFDEDEKVKLPLPIIGLNFPKSGTLTLKEYFKCGGLTSIHTSTQDGRIGLCMRENLLTGKSPLYQCDTHMSKETRQLEPIDFISDIGLQGPPCFYSSLHDGGLDAIAEHYPDATIMLVTRNATSWHRSIKKWGSLLGRWKSSCGFDGRLDKKKNSYWYKKFIVDEPADYWADFYHAHTLKIREFALTHPSLTYVEVELEDPDMAKKMEYYSGVPSTCIMNCHPGPKWHIQNPNATSRCEPIGHHKHAPTPAAVPQPAVQRYDEDGAIEDEPEEDNMQDGNSEDNGGDEDTADANDEEDDDDEAGEEE